MARETSEAPPGMDYRPQTVKQKAPITWPAGLVSRFLNTITFVASATALSSRSDDDAMPVCIVEEEQQRNQRRPAATLRADGGCGRCLCPSSSLMSLHHLLLAP